MHLRQLTHFREGEPFPVGQDSANECGEWNTPPPGCTIHEAYQDPVTRTVVFYSSCNPFGTNPYGGQASSPCDPMGRGSGSSPASAAG